VWMALVFAALGTAPMLRVDWVVFHRLWPAPDHSTVNLACGSVVLMQTLVLMGLWLSRVGDRDLPSRRVATAPWPRWLLIAVAALTGLGALQEVLLVPLGLDPWAAARGVQDRLPTVAVVWAIGVLGAMVMLPRSWESARQGERPSRLLSTFILTAAVGAGLIGAATDAGTMVPLGLRVFWAGYALFIGLALVLAHTIPANSAGRNAWSMIAMSTLWLPSQWGGLVPLFLACGVSLGEAMLAAQVIGVGGIIVVGVAAGFGARVRLFATAPMAVPSAATGRI